ncbi:hypothetical protein IQ235_09045 [Oscillatoriales cyanobacterium LEGE 11467]|uniref:Knr4/Smi1-like domain-containing protein n=1 Tax=Zarconia navalis LEGE 11467 TaxID=1828826 RepID=A0A928VV62_9CYAN|nr:hypothetical protein [Zarconia navalis]MBE9040924.1 hypothetical protein [Zarconia navalis LEGE 11467]
MFETIFSLRSARWELIHDFIDRWYQPVITNDGYREAEIVAAERKLQLRLPAALTEWYLLFGNRDDIWQTQDSLCAPGDLCLDEDGLRFYDENQGCFHWSIPTANLNEDDPPVILNLSGDLIQVNRSLSEHAIQQLLSQTKFNFFSGNGTCSSDILHAVEANYSRCALSDWYLCGADIRFFVDTDLIIEIWKNKNEAEPSELWFATRSKQCCQEITRFFQKCGVVFDTILDDDIYLPNYFKKNI